MGQFDLKGSGVKMQPLYCVAIFVTLIKESLNPWVYMKKKCKLSFVLEQLFFI